MLSQIVRNGGVLKQGVRALSKMGIDHIHSAQLYRLICKDGPEFHKPIQVIDIRPNPIATFPGVQTIPLPELEEALTMNEEDFLETYAFEKPLIDDAVVFGCNIGIRSLIACEIATKLGFTNPINLDGGFEGFFSFMEEKKLPALGWCVGLGDDEYDLCHDKQGLGHEEEM
eukprot:TRINITY_DN781986_c0_g1_i1.p1 TRINITY_DN781986_c0_g1~~TRINITY_DN781986_c0_g1_i1.p1  ORF type:complete len:171 (+),score=61.07 TRINITY_DN781986_c0_g1_i1:76-588(+)